MTLEEFTFLELLTRLEFKVAVNLKPRIEVFQMQLYVREMWEVRGVEGQGFNKIPEFNFQIKQIGRSQVILDL